MVRHSTSRRFRLRPPAALAAAAAVALFASLGSWQLQRAAEKRALLASFEAAGAGETREAIATGLTQYPRYTRLTAHGRYDASRQLLLDNAVHEGQVGYHVWTPFRLDNGAALLVNRGWIPLGASRELLPDLTVGEELRQISGMLDRLPRPGLRLGAGASSEGWPRVMLYPRHEELVAALGYPVFDYLLLLDPGEPGGYLRSWRPQWLPPSRHVGYAVQWFALAAVVVVLFVLLSLRSGYEGDHDEQAT